ncbi:MAG: phosphoribosylanthranilate isomerase [Desulfotalea sp.]
MARTRIKVCGNTDLENSLMAVSCGADALGFIFVKKSKRYVDPSVVNSIVKSLPPFVDKVGVFVNESVDKLLDIAQTCSLTHLQLHGNESPKYCEDIQNKAPHLEIIKVFSVGEGVESENFTLYKEFVSAYLLDTYFKGESGGTGKIFDWKIIKDLRLEKPLILAGGLNADNVVDAVISSGAYCLDVNSGVEVSPGIKDEKKLRALVRNVAEYDLSR